MLVELLKEANRGYRRHGRAFIVLVILAGLGVVMLRDTASEAWALMRHGHKRLSKLEEDVREMKGAVKRVEDGLILRGIISPAAAVAAGPSPTPEPLFSIVSSAEAKGR